MTAKNDADRRSEELRKRKRSAINRHMNTAHRDQAPGGKAWTSVLMGMTTAERINWHYDLHEGDTHSAEGAGHTHEDLEDWQEMERMNGDGETK